MDYYIFYVIAVTLAVTLHIQINPEAAVDSDCTTDINCTETEICNTTTSLCECNDDSYQNRSDECILKSTHGGSCAETSQCQDGLECNDTSSGTCGCVTDNYYDGSTCLLKSSHGGTCTNNTQCQDGLICYNTKCGCQGGTYYDGSSCVSSTPALVPVITDVTSTYNSFTVTWTRTNDSNGYMSTYTLEYNGNEMSITSPDTTTQSVIGLDSNIDYSVVIKRFITYNGVDQDVLESTSPRTVTTKSGHGQSCGSSNEVCDDRLRCMNNLCVCEDGNYYVTMLPCTPSSPSLVPVSTATTTYSSFNVTWTQQADPEDYVSIYKLMYTGLATPISITGGSTSYEVIGLQSHTDYSVSILRYLDYKGVVQSPISSPISVRTKSGHSQLCGSSNEVCDDRLRCMNNLCVCEDGNYYVTMLPCTPSSPSLVPVSTATTTYNSLNVTWTQQADPDDYVSTYKLTYTGLATPISITGGSTSYEVLGLQSNTDYSVSILRYLDYKGVVQSPISSPISVRTKSGHGQLCGSSNEVCDDRLRCMNNLCVCEDGNYYVTMLPCSSSSPSLVPVSTATTTYNSLNVTWTQQADPEDYVSTYKLTYTGLATPISITGGSTSYEVIGLQSNTDYSVSILRYLDYKGVVQSPISSPISVRTKSGHKDPCSSATSCDNRLTCYTTSSVCVCPNGTYYRERLPCVSINELIPTFSLRSQLTSITLTFVSKPDTGTLYSSTYTARLIPGNIDHNFTTNPTLIPELSEGTVYRVTVTRTLTLATVGRTQTTDSSPAQSYSTKVSYNNTCITNGTCNDVNTDCYGGRCLCDLGHYWRDGTCHRTTELAPRSVQVNTVDTTHVTVSWTPPPNSGYVSGYRVDATPTDHNDHDPPAVEVTGGANISKTLTGLQPGTQYTFTVDSKSTNDGRVEYVHGNENPTSVTKPAAISSLDEGNSNVTAPDMKIAFQPAQQKFLSYTVTLRGETDGYYQQVTVAGSTDGYYFVVFRGVTSGNYYTVTVVTNSVENSQSEPFTQRQRVMAAQASEVVDLKNTTTTSRSVIINWMRPDNPNGLLLEYSLEVSRDNVCKTRVVFNCTQCFRTSIQYNISDTSCQTTVTKIINETEINDETHVVEHNVTSLDPDTSYTIQAVAYNEEGRGKGQNPLHIHTNSEPARRPRSVTTHDATSNTTTVSWVPESPRPGNTSYVVEVLERNEDNDEFSSMKNLTVWGYSINTLAVQGLSSYWKYKFQVNSQSEVPPASVFISTGVITTEESAPTQVVDLEAKTIPEVYDKVRLSWQCPPQKDGRNGVIQTATVKYESVDQREGVVPETGEKTFDATKSCSLNDYELDITAEVNYTFTVFISNSFEGAPSVVKRYMPAGPAVIRTGGVSKQQKAVSDKENTVPLAICPECLQSRRNGLVESSGVLLCKNKCPTDRLKREVKMKEYYEGIDNWQKASKGGFSSQYRASPPSWLDELTSTDPKSAVYEIGSNSSCDATDESGFCNGPLPEGSTFVVYVFVCTTAGCALSDPVTVKTKEPDSNIRLIAGAVGGVVAAIIIVIAVIVFLKLRKKRSKDHKAEYVENEPDESELVQKKRPIPLCDFPEKVEEMHRDSNLLFSEEFEDITAISPKHNCVASETGSNKLKNRYVNILPFDHSRVKLRPLEDEDEETDYINANYIPGYRSLREYIATQGPMTGTINDFWRLIWEQNVPIIVMLSDLSEKGRPKVDRYYPENMEPVNYGDIRVEMTNFSPLSKYVIRIFKIQLGEEVRTVRHYFLPGWQDFGANLTSDNVIDFIKSVRMEIKPNNNGPLCIHCSAGVGRTGTYITLDVFQQQIDEEIMDKELDIFDFVMKMRGNRSYMVQTEKQYIFIHDTIMEMVLRKKKEIAERDKNIYMNTSPDEDLYMNQAFETDPSDIYMNVDTATNKPTTAL